MKNLLFITILIISQISKADYHPLSLLQMALTSDLIVIGSISEIEDEYFTFEIQEIVGGEITDKSIKVKRYVNRPCASRWTEYTLGQELLLFLLKTEDNTYLILSDGGEGELPISKTNVYLSSWYGFDMPFMITYRIDKDGTRQAFYFQAYELYGSIYYGLEFSLLTFADVIKEFRDICKHTESKENYSCDCDNDKLEIFKSKNDLCFWFSQQVLVYGKE